MYFESRWRIPGIYLDGGGWLDISEQKRRRFLIFLYRKTSRPHFLPYLSLSQVFLPLILAAFWIFFTSSPSQTAKLWTSSTVAFQQKYNKYSSSSISQSPLSHLINYINILNFFSNFCKRRMLVNGKVFHWKFRLVDWFVFFGSVWLFMFFWNDSGEGRRGLCVKIKTF